jgi:SRSO17 transposase
MEYIADSVPNTNDQTYQHFLCRSPWNNNSVIEQLYHDANQYIGGRDDSCLLINETCIPQKGRKSIGVSRQHYRQLGKTDNCQVGLFAVLGSGQYIAPIDCRLYLPKSWVNDKERCRQADIPDEFIDYQHKQNLAVQLVMTARLRGAQFNWVGCDVFYGEEPFFLRSLDNMGEIFIADIAKTQLIYLDDPSPYLPAPKSSKGRRPTKLKTKSESICVCNWTKQQPESAWKRVHVENITKGKLQVAILHQKVWLWDHKTAKTHRWHLIVRKLTGTNDIKYSLSNASLDTSLEHLTYMQGQCYLTEYIFQDAKAQHGMGQYQAKGWRSWHHYMSMIMLSMLFKLQQQFKESGEDQLLSRCNIMTWLNHYLHHRKISEEELYNLLKRRHEKRQRTMQTAYCKQLLKDKAEFN